MLKFTESNSKLIYSNKLSSESPEILKQAFEIKKVTPGTPFSLILSDIIKGIQANIEFSDG